MTTVESHAKIACISGALNSLIWSYFIDQQLPNGPSCSIRKSEVTIPNYKTAMLWIVLRETLQAAELLAPTVLTQIHVRKKSFLRKVDPLR